MSYFQKIKDRATELDEQAQAYLDTLEFLPNDEVMQRIHVKAWEIFKSNNENWDKVPEWVASTVDGWIPYTSAGYRNGSLLFALGFSVVSQDAHLRNLMEMAEGRETKELDFPVVAELPARSTKIIASGVFRPR